MGTTCIHTYIAFTCDGKTYRTLMQHNFWKYARIALSIVRPQWVRISVFNNIYLHHSVSFISIKLNIVRLLQHNSFLLPNY